MSLLTLFLPRGATVPYSRYLLGGTRLPRPVKITRDFIFVKSDMLALDGKTSRDITAQKEHFVLSFENISKKIANRIISICNLNEEVTFVVTETNLAINTTVWPFIPERVYQKGGSAFVSFDLELMEVS